MTSIRANAAPIRRRASRGLRENKIRHRNKRAATHAKGCAKAPRILEKMNMDLWAATVYWLHKRFHLSSGIGRACCMDASSDCLTCC